MSAAVIVIDQTGVSDGVAGQSRDDLIIGAEVQLTNSNDSGVRSWRWSLLDVPIGSNAVLSNPILPNPTFTPDVVGTYRVQLIVDAGVSGQVDRRVAIIRDPQGRRIPAAGEGQEANYPLPTGVLNSQGYHPDLADILDRARTQIGDAVLLSQFGAEYHVDWDPLNPPEDCAPALVEAFAYLAAHPGTRLIIQPGHYQLTEAEMTNVIEAVIDAYGAVFHITGVGAGAIGGIRMVGTVSSVDWLGGTFIGDNDESSGFRGLWGSSNGVQVTHCSFQDIEFREMNIGFSFGFDNDGGTSFAERCWINNIRCFDMVGTDPGEGYGVHVANFGYDRLRQIVVTNCIFTRCLRHGLYFARGSGYAFDNIVLYQHHGTAGVAGERAGVAIARSRQVNGGRIISYDSRNTTILITAGEVVGEDLEDVSIDSIEVHNPSTLTTQAQIVVGSSAATPIANNRNVYIGRIDAQTDGWTGTAVVQVNWGHSIHINNPRITRSNNATAVSYAMFFQGLSGAGNPEDWSSDWLVSHARLDVSGSDGRHIRVNSNVLNNPIDLTFRESDLLGDQPHWALQTAQANGSFHWYPRVRPLDVSEVVLGATWGDAPTITLAPGSSTERGTITVTPGGTGVGAQPTITLPLGAGYIEGQVIPASAVLVGALGGVPTTISNSVSGLNTYTATVNGAVIAGVPYVIQYGIGAGNETYEQRSIFGVTSTGALVSLVRLGSDVSMNFGSSGITAAFLTGQLGCQMVADTTPICSFIAAGVRVESGSAIFPTAGNDLILQSATGQIITQDRVSVSESFSFPSYTDGTRPAAGNEGAVIFNTDDGNLNIDDGTNWILPDGTVT